MTKNSEDIAPIAWTSVDDKDKHLQLCLEKDVASSQTSGFEKFYLLNDPLPGIDFGDVDLSCELLGKKISAPFMILPMTGGTKLSAKINKNLAVAAQELGLAMAVGSQRLGIEDPSLAVSYQVREVAPDIPLFANLGAIYLNHGYGLEECERAVEMIGADGLTLYLNPMQKIFQGNRNLNFKGLMNKIAHICQHLSVPVIVKEVGFGLSRKTALLLKAAGVKILDVAGAGGTSWVKISRYLKQDLLDEDASAFDDWGIPTSAALISSRDAVKEVRIIASGGIRSGTDVAKALALGADYVGMALPLLAPAMESSEAVVKRIEKTLDELKIAMFGCGAATVQGFRQGKFIRSKCSSTCHRDF